MEGSILNMQCTRDQCDKNKPAKECRNGWLAHCVQRQFQQSNTNLKLNEKLLEMEDKDCGYTEEYVKLVGLT